MNQFRTQGISFPPSKRRRNLAGWHRIDGRPHERAQLGPAMKEAVGDFWGFSEMDKAWEETEGYVEWMFREYFTWEKSRRKSPVIRSGGNARKLLAELGDRNSRVPCRRFE